MGAEVGATTSLFAYDAHTAAYLRSTGRDEVADLADALGITIPAEYEAIA